MCALLILYFFVIIVRKSILLWNVCTVCYLAVLTVACIDVASSEGDGRGKQSIDYERVIVNVVSFLHATIDVLLKAGLNLLLLYHCHLSILLFMPQF